MAVALFGGEWAKKMFSALRAAGRGLELQCECTSSSPEEVLFFLYKEAFLLLW